MTRFKLSILSLLAALTAFFNIERLNFGVPNVIDIQSFVYVVGILAVLAILVAPVEWGVGVWITGWLLVYFLSKLFIFDSRPIIGGIHTYIFITEVALLSILILLAHQTAEGLREFQNAIDDLTLTEGGKRIPQLTGASEQVDIEFTRSRRHNRPISVFVVEPQPGGLEATQHRMVKELQEAMITRYIINSLGHKLTREMRRTELVFEHPSKDRLVILSPETDSTRAKELVRRINATALERFGMPVHCRTATFPDQAYTFEELLRMAESDTDADNQTV